MDTVTYPDPATVQMFHDHLVGVRAPVRSEPVLAQRFAVQYTPTVVILDDEGTERYRNIGFLPPQDFIPSVLLGIGKTWYEKGRFNKAATVLEKLLSNYPRSPFVSEASNLKRAADKQAG